MKLQRAPAVTKAEAALNTLREAIRRGDLPSGTHLVLGELAASLGMSYTPIREAMRQLHLEGLVEYRPHFGAVVSEQSLERAEEIYMLRRTLEPLAGALAAERATAEDIAEIEAIYEKLSTHVEASQFTPIPQLNAELHKRIYQASGSSILTDFIDRLWNGVPYQSISLEERVRESHKEHRRIIDALKKQDPDAVAEELRRHLERGEAAARARMKATDR